MSRHSSNTQTRKRDGNVRSNAVSMERSNSLGAHACIQRESGGHGVQPHAPSLVREVLNSPGQPLDNGVRASMEPQFGFDFSGVRVHTDERASESAQAVGANAYTAGSHIAFGAGRYAPCMTGGRQLIGHELAHVVQQSEGDVSGTPIGDGFHVSHPGDSFERRAAAIQTNLGSNRGDGAESQPSPYAAATRQPSGEVHIQRASLGLTTGESDQGAGKNVNEAASLNAWSALGSAVAGLGSMLIAFEGLKFARRQAEAAEDPPVAEPTTGGVNSTHIELPEVKGIDPGDLKDHLDTSDEEEEEETVISGLKGNKSIPESEKTSLTKELKTRKFKKKTVMKKADKADQEKSFTVLRLQQGAQNLADFLLTLRYNGKDVRGGATEDGQIAGYLGGSAESNAAVTFRASPGAPIINQDDAGSAGKAAGDTKGQSGKEESGTATVRLLFGGTNVPPRKKQSGSLGVVFGSAKTEDYKVQRFSAAAKFSGAGEFKGFDTLFATPPDRSVVTKGTTGTPGDPLVTIGLATSDIEKAKQLQAINPSTPQAAPATPPQKP
ncbi:MAG TPA: DUF4157 domain-containing protein [Terracidiphilus sp.]|nr:DUF4157 domain-containing protein [Terracidiphilus sp.]